MRDSRCELHAGVPGEQRLDERPRGRPLRDVEAAPPGGAAGRVGVREVEGGGVHLGRVGHGDGAAEAERVEVGLRDRHPHGVEVHAGTGEAGAGERDEVATDPAAEVHQGRDVRGARPGRPVGGDRQPGGLLEPLGREVHPPRQLAELRLGAAPQLHLGHRGGDVLRARRTPQRRLGPQGVRRQVGACLRGRGEEPLPLLGQQPAEGVEVHTGHPRLRPAAATAKTARGPLWHSSGQSASFSIGTLPVSVPALVPTYDPRDGVRHPQAANLRNPTISGK